MPAAATEVCRIGRAAWIRRSRRVRRPAREASAACSSSSSRRGSSSSRRATCARARGAPLSSAQRTAIPARGHVGRRAERGAGGYQRRLVEPGVAREGGPEVGAQVVGGERTHAERVGERGEVGGEQVHAEVRVAAAILVVAQHAVAPIVHHHGGERYALLRGRGQLAAGVEEAAVAGHAHHRPGAGQRRAEGLREGAAERAPAQRIEQPSRRRAAGGSRRASSRGCTCRRPRSPPPAARW